MPDSWDQMLGAMICCASRMDLRDIDGTDDWTSNYQLAAASSESK